MSDLIQPSIRRRDPYGHLRSQGSSAVSPTQPGQNFKVAVRLRPMIERESRTNSQQCVRVELEHRAIVITKPEPKRRQGAYIGIDDIGDVMKPEQSQNFFFDVVFGPNSTQDEVYDICAHHIVVSVLEGYNGSIIAYGQTGTGKSYTIEGADGDNKRGIIPRASEHIFSYIRSTATKKDRFLVRVSFLEIYNEKITDLLDPRRENLRLREDGSGGVYVEGLSEHVVRSTDEIKKHLRDGAHARTTAETRMNKESSRSHAVFNIIVEHAMHGSEGGSSVTIAKLRLVDLAGSERIDMDSETKRQEETKNINVSLHTFGMVVMALTSGGTHQHVPYRDAKLTRILQDSLGGNCKTTLVTTITPVSNCHTESLNSLKFAKRAKHVKNNAVINKDVSQKALLSAYQQEIQKLRQQLSSQGGGSLTEEELQALTKEKEAAQKEKAEVLSKLEMQEQLFKRAQEEKEHFAQRILDLEAMLLQGGGKQVSESSEFKRAIEIEKEKIRTATEHELQSKLEELDKEKKRLALEREDLQKQREYFSKMRADFLPDGQHAENALADDASEFKKGRLGRKPSLPAPGLASRLPPHAANAPWSAPQSVNGRSKAPAQRRHSFGVSTTPTQAVPRPQHNIFDLSAMSRGGQLYSMNIREALLQYEEALADPKMGIPCQEFQSGIRIFTGADAVKWFMRNMEGVVSPDKAQEVGQRLMDLGIISEIQGDAEFTPSASTFYQFVEMAFASPSATPAGSRPLSALSIGMFAGSSTISMGPDNLHAGSYPLIHQRSGSVPIMLPMTRAWEYSSPALTQSLASLRVTPGEDLLTKYQLTQLSPSPLHVAAIAGEQNKVQDLAQRLSVNSLDLGGNTPLMYAALGRQAKCCSLLVKHLRADVNWINHSQQSALMMAVTNDFGDVAKVLLKLGARNDYTNTLGENVFHIAADKKSSRCLEVLLKYSKHLGAVNERNNKFLSSLHLAVLADQPTSVELLLKSCANLGVSDQEGRTALHYAAITNAVLCIMAITQACPNDVNLVDCNGRTALHLACQIGSVECIKALINSPVCDCTLQDDNGLKPTDIAKACKRSDIVSLLQAKSK